MKRFRIKTTPYPDTLHVRICSREQGTAWLKREGQAADLSDCEGMVVDCENTHVLLWLLREDDLPIMVHEIVHAAVAILGHAGVPIDDDHDEAAAYLISHLLRTILERAKRKKHV